MGVGKLLNQSLLKLMQGEERTLVVLEIGDSGTAKRRGRAPIVGDDDRRRLT